MILSPRPLFIFSVFSSNGFIYQIIHKEKQYNSDESFSDHKISTYYI